MISDELYHYGIKGMKWGVRRSRNQLAYVSSMNTRTSKHTIRMANKDAKRYMDAKMFYGKTAGTKRKLLNAELERKKKTIDGYKVAFDEAIKNVNVAASAKKAIRTRKTIDAVHRVKITAKQILGITGSLTATAGLAIYHANKTQIDAFVAKQFYKAVSAFRK